MLVDGDVALLGPYGIFVAAVEAATAAQAGASGAGTR
jgi:hypothetical protein